MLELAVPVRANASRAPPPGQGDTDLLLPCGEQPHWIFGDGGSSEAPPLPWRDSLWSQPIAASLVVFFVGNATGEDTPAETRALARFGHIGIGWQHSGDYAKDSHEGHIELEEQRTARELKAINPAAKVLAIRNDQVVSSLWDGARAKMLDPGALDFWLRDESGNPIVNGTAWNSTRPSQPMPSGALTQLRINFTQPAAREWWATSFVGSALDEPGIDGAYFDCACDTVLSVDELRRQHAAAAPAVQSVLSHAAASGKWLSGYKPDGPTAACDKPQVTRDYCAEPLRFFVALGSSSSSSSSNRTMIMLHDYRDTRQTVAGSVAAFLIARGDSALLRLDSCVGCAYNKPTPPWSPLFERTVGRPVGPAVEAPAGVFTREYEEATVRLNCSAYDEASIRFHRR